MADLRPFICFLITYRKANREIGFIYILSYKNIMNSDTHRHVTSSFSQVKQRLKKLIGQQTKRSAKEGYDISFL